MIDSSVLHTENSNVFVDDVRSPAVFKWSSMPIRDLIALTEEHLREAHEISGELYPEVKKYLFQMPVWKRKLSSENHRMFWARVAEETKSLIGRIQDHMYRGTESTFEEHQIPQNALTSQHKSWADYTSSSEEEAEISYLYSHVQTTSNPNGILVPADLQTVWPKCYNVLLEACQVLGLDMILDELTLGRAGFKAGPALSTDESVAKEAFSRLSLDDQRSVNILKSLIIFLKLEPDRILASDNKFALSASYVLHFLLKTGDPENDSKLSRSMKHHDGGRSLIIDKISPLFQTDRSIVHTLMTAVDRICRSLARSTRAKPNVFTDELRSLIVDMCYTSPEGMLENYYVRERREVVSWVQETDSRGRKKPVKKTKLVNGFRAPGLMLGEELLLPVERHRLKEFEHRFSMPKLAKKSKETFLRNGGAPEQVTTVIEKLVTDGYSLTTLISSVIRRRKKSVRAEALKASQTGKLTPSQWVVAAERVMTEASPMSEHTYLEIARFLEKWESDD